ncbi:ECF transporter S component [Clostridium chauvoei]|nr:ECF transporter S component [Clostridium chauvoei]ATD56247.1 ECF transporter S component [Clostridium chauvoei]ATD58656.1 ECF transporter S component [Clostridium chauvoei]MBX7280081.1 ECF transporter S component [Clostridium chauvoei]MBX7282565.1 ECF transporter S component [Clostridium chauvoei]MBX7284972.1 ECF transporter S component [Clostridium chauvoei]
MSGSRGHVRKMVMIAMLSGISIFLGVSGLGFITLPIFRLTIMHVPVIIGAILEGPIVGATVGLMFGLFSMYQNFTAPTLTSFVFYNPIVALVPRVLIGIVAYYIYKLLKNIIKNKSVTIGISAVLATLTNTVGVLGLTYLLYLEQYAAARDISTTAVSGTLLAIGVSNGIPEAIVSALITIPVVLGILKIKKQ